MTFSKSGVHSSSAETAAVSPQKERGSSLRWSPSTVGALPGMCPNRSSGRDHREMIAPRENSIVVSALAVIGDVETLAFRFHGGTKTDDHVDELVEDRRSNAGPEQRGSDGLALRNHLGDEVVGTGVVAGDVGVVGDADAT